MRPTGNRKSLRMRSELHGNLCARPATEDRRIAHKARAENAGTHFRSGRAAISEDCSLAEERAPSAAPQSALASPFVFVIAIHLERHAPRHGPHGLLAFSKAFRGGRLRSDDRFRLLAWPGRVLCTGQGNFAGCESR